MGDTSEQIGEAIAEAIDEHTGDQVDQAVEIAEGAVALAEEQAALAQLQAARTIEEHSANVRSIEEQVAWLTNEMTSLRATNVQTHSQLESVLTQLQELKQLSQANLQAELLEQAVKVEPEPEQKMEVEVVEPESVAVENPVAKTETRKSKVRRI
jgi:hypothetical protein